MYNFFSFIWIHFRKWTDGTRKDIVKMILSATVFLSCFWVLVKWNTVPRYEDNIEIDAYRGKSIINDSLAADISIRRPYLTFYSLQNDSAGYEVGFTGTCSRDTAGFINYNTKADSLWSVLKTEETLLSIDSVVVLFNVKAKIHLYSGLKPSSINENQGKIRKKDFICFFDTYNTFDSTNRCLANGEFWGVIKDRTHIKKDELLIYSLPPIESSILAEMSPLSKLFFTKCDLSQCYYTFKVKMNNSDTHVKSLNIDFGGATRFSGIYPVPDCITSTGIKYTDKNKLHNIESFGLRVYCQFLESSAVQSLRAYAVTTVATFFLTLFLKILIEVLWRKFKGFGDMLIRK